jgi:hypothetical protein
MAVLILGEIESTSNYDTSKQVLSFAVEGRLRSSYYAQQ